MSYIGPSEALVVILAPSGRMLDAEFGPVPALEAAARGWADDAARLGRLGA